MGKRSYHVPGSRVRRFAARRYRGAVANHPSRVAELTARYGSDEALGVVYDEVAGATLLPDGGRASNCADCAYYIRSLEPNTAIYGFWSRENTDWAGAILVDGHDFAVVDGRYIVDPWILETERLSDRAVFDLKNPVDRSEVRRLYGDRKSSYLIELPVGRLSPATTWARYANHIGR